MFSLVLLVANSLGTLEILREGEKSLAVTVTMVVGIMDFITFGIGYLVGGM